MMYAIKYQRVLDDEDVDNLVPVGLVQGTLQESREYFETKDEIYAYIENPILDGKYIIGAARTIDEIRAFYNFDRNYSDDEVINFFYDDEKAKTLFVRDGIVRSVDKFNMFHDESSKELYQVIDGENSVILNMPRINELLENDPETLKEEMSKYPQKMASFDEIRETHAVDAIMVKNGHVVEIDRKKQIAPEILAKVNSGEVNPDSSEFSVRGLYAYLRERIIGHDVELKRIATRLITNYKSTKEYGTETILIPGPTGTGKTATFKCASKYLNVPFKVINAINLVPEGIEGTSIEDVFETLLDSCGGDIVKAEKAILVFDEFDKLGIDTLDTKTSLVNIFLKVLEGGEFPITKQLKTTRIFDTTMASKICLGAFSEAYKKSANNIGFGSLEKEEPVFDRKLLVDKGYFSKELLDRFQLFVPYEQLTESDKKRILLESKISKLLLQKQKYEETYGVTMDGLNEFVEGLLAQLTIDDTSIRDMENLMSMFFVDVDYELEDNKGKYNRLVLSRDSISKGLFDLS